MKYSSFKVKRRHNSRRANNETLWCTTVTTVLILNAELTPSSHFAVPSIKPSDKKCKHWTQDLHSQIPLKRKERLLLSIIQLWVEKGGQKTSMDQEPDGWKRCGQYVKTWPSFKNLLRQQFGAFNLLHICPALKYHRQPLGWINQILFTVSLSPETALQISWRSDKCIRKVHLLADKYTALFSTIIFKLVQNN